MKVKKLFAPLAAAHLEARQEEGRWIIEGYATVWGNVNCYGFCIARGAYGEVLRSGTKPKMFFGHDSSGVPIGKWTELVEDEVGLRVTGELTQGVGAANDVYAAIKAGTVDGLSVAINWRYEDEELAKDGHAIVKRISYLGEISVVTYPADGKAGITKCLSEIDEIDERIESIQTVRELENFFRENMNLSKRQSGWLIAKARSCLTSDICRDDESDVTELLMAFDRIKSTLKTIN